ncbi:MAG: serine/threonine protein kinase [Myxococcota bacterium]|jgi:serine/threonine protein kinase
MTSGGYQTGSSFFTMKVITGLTFRALMKETSPGAATSAGMRRLVDVLYQTAAAVGCAHRRGVIHRDLKPANLLVGADGEVLIVDRGIARVSGENPDAPLLTERPAGLPGTTLAGTPAYMAPEQARGEAVTASSDVWAMGAVLCEILTGAYPHRGEVSWTVWGDG